MQFLQENSYTADFLFFSPTQKRTIIIIKFYISELLSFCPYRNFVGRRGILTLTLNEGSFVIQGNMQHTGILNHTKANHGTIELDRRKKTGSLRVKVSVFLPSVTKRKVSTSDPQLLRRGL